MKKTFMLLLIFISCATESFSQICLPLLEPSHIEVNDSELASLCHFLPEGPKGKRGHRGHRGPTGAEGPQGIQGETGPTGPTGIQGPVVPLNNVIYVDGKTTSDAPDGSIANPYPSIQTAIDSIPAPVGILDKLQSFVIYITSGTYNEDLVLNVENTQIELVALGLVYLVDPMTFTPRNVTINFTAITDFGVGFGDSVSFTNVNAKTFSNNYLQFNQSGLFVITGILTINDISSVANPNVSNLVLFNGSIVDFASTGNAINGTGSTKRHILNLNNTFLFSNINAPNAILNARDSTFNFANLLSYGSIFNCLIGTPSGGLTISQLPETLSDNLVGIYSSRLGGVFTGPPPVGSQNAYLFDGATNYWFINNGSSFAGGATKELIFSAL